jgi:ferric-dicitrate binding protein FerR (iron transport regulator)
MTEHENQDREERSRRAAALYVHLKDEFSLKVLWQLLRWLLSSWLNVQEFLQMYRQDEALTRTKLSRHAAQWYQSNVTHVNWWKGSSLKSDERQNQKRVVRWRVAVAAVVISFTVYLAVSKPSIEPSRVGISQELPGIEPPADTIATSVDSPPITQQLSDGTEVTVDAGTTLRLRFTDASRDVRLLEGRVTFDVAEDAKTPKRPFVVNTHSGRVSAVGTKFVVAVDIAGIDVQVYDGEVEILPRSKSGSVIKLKSGQPAHRVPIDGLSALAGNGEGGMGVVAPKG